MNAKEIKAILKKSYGLKFTVKNFSESEYAGIFCSVTYQSDKFDITLHSFIRDTLKSLGCQNPDVQWMSL